MFLDYFSPLGIPNEKESRHCAICWLVGVYSADEVDRFMDPDSRLTPMWIVCMSG